MNLLRIMRYGRKEVSKVYKTIHLDKNEFYGVFGWQIVTNSHLFKPFLTLLDLGGHYGHKMCVFPQEYELFPY